MKNLLDRITARLAAAAREAEPEAAGEASPFLATRVLATLRERVRDRFWWEFMARRIAISACAATAIAWLALPVAPSLSEDPEDLAAAFLAAELEP